MICKQYKRVLSTCHECLHVFLTRRFINGIAFWKWIVQWTFCR